MKEGLAARLATAVALIAALLAALFLLPPAGLAALAALLVAGAAHEWARLCGLKAAWLYALSLAAMVAFLFFRLEASWQGVFALAAMFWALLVPLWLWRGVPGSRVLAMAGVLALVPAGLAMAVLPPRQLLAVLVLIWIADSAAYFVGRAFGRRKLAPSISPGKTWEGAAGGAAGAMAWAIILATSTEGIAWVPFLAAAAVLAAISIVGDLFESAVKRKAGVKDSGALLPGHGGILDRIDSALAALPVAALLAALVLPALRSAA
ncbi:MAG: phosphatidate cytidylyltransferase [Betaproteobacteria bacterium]